MTIPADKALSIAKKYKSIKVLSPNGGETWRRETAYTIKWRSQGISGNVKIMLKGGSGKGGLYTVTENTPNTGTFIYSGVPRNYGWNDFKIIVMTLDGSVKDESDNKFTVR